MKLKKILPLFILTLIMLSFIGCGGKVDEASVRKFSDNAVKETLTAMKNNDTKKYIDSFDDNLKSLLPEDKTKETLSIIKSKIGSYTDDSLKFQKAIKQSKDGKKFITAIYSAKFSDESSDVVITAIFEDGKENPKLQTFLLNSPKLRK